MDFYVLWLEDPSQTSNGSEPDGEVPFVSSCDGRVYIRSGQQWVHELAQQGETPKGVERYLAQFWPK
ncbi:hypothetical protein ACFVTY_03695 [Streptomyces sp. NPDC058067]|uniref:hypothetical protein n=1 Tax=Streptomyces sp. NPDC058067 TaxID=3346324 RepID=UPI0036E3EEB7